MLERLFHLGSTTTFGCNLQFVQTNTLQVLADPPSTNHGYYVIARQCMVEARHKRQLKGKVKAIRVLRSRNDKIHPQAFSFCTEIRHVLVENGVKIVGEAAWRSCRQLQIVHLPDTVVSLLHGAWPQAASTSEATNCGFRNRTIFLTPKWGPRFVIKTQRQRQHVTQLKKAFVSSVGFAFALATAFAFAAMTTVCSLATTTLSHSAFYEPQARQRRQPKRRMGIIPLTVLRAPNILGALCSFLFFPNASQRVLV